MRAFAGSEHSNNPFAKESGLPASKPSLPVSPIPNSSYAQTMLPRKEQCACGGGCPSCQSKSNLDDQGLSSAGRRLDSNTRADFALRFRRDIRRPGRDLGSLLAPMEWAYGADFSAVRVHTDSVAEAHDARAVTIGEDIHLSASERNLASPGARELVGHELAHVLQQRPGRGTTASSLALESEADRAGASVAKGNRAEVMGAVASPGRAAQRAPKVAPAPPTGNILYVGMNNPDP